MIIAVPRSAQHLHWLLLKSVSRAPLWFFTTTDSSTLLNRFSQDMTLVDQVLPMAVFTTTFDVYNVIQRCLNVVLDLLVALIAVILVGFALGLSNTATKGSIGLALLNVMEFNTSLSMLVNSWTGLETSLGAIAPLKTFVAETKAEDRDGEDGMLPQDWPQLGAIQMKGVTAKYE